MKEFHFAILRIAMGFIFLWAFLDKLLGLGLATKATSAWLSGGSPTTGFLKFATSGPLKTTFESLSGAVWVDWLFMIGLLLLGISLILGIGMRLASYGGTLLLFLMWLALYPVENNPFIDEHIIYILVLYVLLYTNAGDYWGLGRWWGKTSLVKSFPILK
jgi:thiosulfate dehydrogenase (quinone) large subunit